jgi:hypothetical protein
VKCIPNRNDLDTVGMAGREPGKASQRVGRCTQAKHMLLDLRVQKGQALGREPFLTPTNAS